MAEAPVLTYVGEISEPSIRGILTAFASICATIGLFLVYLLNTFMPWRMVGLMCLAVPLIAMIAICFVSNTREHISSEGPLHYIEMLLIVT